MNDPTDELYIPQLFATITYKKTDESQMNNAITLSRLTSQDTTITITTEESGYTIDKPGLHVDTPVIFYSETEKNISPDLWDWTAVETLWDRINMQMPMGWR